MSTAVLDTNRYLLLLACSSRKRTDTAPVPAIDRYTGVNYTVLRKAQRLGYWPEHLDVLILSAKYGLIEPTTLIPCYDQRMTSVQARALQSEVSAYLDACLAANEYSEVFVNLGTDYLLAIAASKLLPQLGGAVKYACGGLGQKMAHMKGWLQSIHSS